MMGAWFLMVTLIFLKRYLEINRTGDGGDGSSGADWLVKKDHGYENIQIETRGSTQNV